MFTAPYTVTIGDINYGRHLGNERPLLIFQDARIRFLASMGFSEANIGEGKGTVIVETGCTYLRQVFLHEELDIHVTIGELEGKKCRFNFRAIRRSDREPVFSGFTLMLAYDYDTRKAVKLPEIFVVQCRKSLAEK